MLPSTYKPSHSSWVIHFANLEAPLTQGGRYLLLFLHRKLPLGPALSTIGKAIASVRAYKNGCLEVHFADASTLSVKPDAEYEAWEIAGTGGLRVVCTPGGSLSIWQPEGVVVSGPS